MTKSNWIEWRPTYRGHKPDLVREDRVEYQLPHGWEPCLSGPGWYEGDVYRFPVEDLRGHNGGPSLNSLPDDATARLEYPMADGLLDYFPNALAEVSRLSYLATQQHHPDKPMHWDRSKSTDHRNKILRHLIDTDGVDDKGIDHWAMVCWRALAGYQEYLEKKHGLRPSRASKNLPTT